MLALFRLTQDQIRILGEIKVQGKEKHLSRVMTQVSSLKRGGHNASQIDCNNLPKQFSCNDEAEEVNTQACKKIVQRLETL